MKRTTLIVAAAATAIMSLNAQSAALNKLDCGSMNALMEYRESVRINPHNATGKTVEVLVLLAEDADTSRIEDLGASVNWVEGDIAAVTVAMDKLEDLGSLLEVRWVELSTPLRPMLNYARPSGNVDAAQNGFDYNGATYSFTGKGVITGLYDEGIQPAHINFMGTDGDTRVLVFNKFTGDNGSYSSSRDLYDMVRAQTDNSGTSHGTHVAGIMAGSYNGNGRYASVATPTTKRCDVVDGNIPYYGVATGSSIVMNGGPLGTNNIAAGVLAVAEEAKDLGMPSVVNLSIGTNTGAHDGTDLLTRSIAKYADQTIIVVSAGNEGDSPFFIEKKFDNSSLQVKTFIAGNSGSGTIEIWGNDSKSFKATMALYANSGGTLTEICSVENENSSASASSSSLFSTNYDGSISMSAKVNSLNNRFYVSISINASQKAGKSGQNLALIVDGVAGQTVYIYGNEKTTFTNNNRSAWTKGSCDGTINTLACGKGIISIGAYTTRTSWGILNGQCYYYNNNNYVIDEIAPFSSWGRSFDGTNLPTVCAPGANIVSSFNRFNVKDASTATASAPNGSNTDYWGAMQGTSMSSPYAAGVIALWLEADPSMSVNDIIEVINATSQKVEAGDDLFPGFDDEDEETDENARWGAGKIDAVAGLRYVLDHRAGVGTVIADDKAIITSTEGRGIFRITASGESALSASLFDMGGSQVAHAAATGSELILDASSATAGIYVLHIEGTRSASTSKVVIR